MIPDTELNPYEPTLSERPAPWETKIEVKRFRRRGGCYGFCLHMFYLGVAGRALAVLVFLIERWIAEPGLGFSLAGIFFIFTLVMTYVLLVALPVALVTYVACIIVAQVFRIRSSAIWTVLMAAFGVGYGNWWCTSFLDESQPLFLTMGAIIGGACGLILAPHWSRNQNGEWKN